MTLTPRRTGVPSVCHAGLLAVAVSLGAAGSAAAQQPRLDELKARAQANRQDPEALQAYGRALVKAGHYGRAKRQLKRAAKLRDHDLQALYEVARVAFAQGDYRAARAACRPLQQKDRDAVLTHVCRARAFLVWNRSSRAFEELEKALAQDRDHFEAQLAIGDAHRLRANVPKAEQAYRKAAKARPGEARPYLGLGRLYVAAGRHDDAVTALRKAHGRDPHSPAIQYQLGRLLGDSDEAVSLLREAARGKQGWASPHAALATVHMRRDSPGKAAKHFRKALDLNEELAPAHAGLGRALMALGKHEKAEKTLKKALELVPNSQQAIVTLGNLYEKTGRPEDAFEQYRHAADVDPSNPEPLLEATRLALRQERDVLAAGFLDRLMQRHDELAPALALYGDVMKVRGRREKARSYYERALEAKGELDRERVRKALAELDEPKEQGEQMQPAMVRP